MIKVNVCVPLIGILCFITIETIEAAKYAGRQQRGVCSAYADYEDCIRTSIGKLRCRLLPSEAELHETDITNVYTKYPYQCTKTQNGWIAALTARSSAPGLLLSNPIPWFLLAISSWL
uniref:Uncharacterized protein n=1 Tax=Magallana gigas TaxID=29159 RepID=A0A8W8N079_MAGGI